MIMLGGLGDILIALPMAWHYAQRFGTPTPFLTSARYQNLLAGCSYVKSVGYDGPVWRGYREAIEWAKKRYECVLPLHVGEPEICAQPKTTQFCHEQFLHAGLAGRYGEFPLIFDKRSPEREARLVARVKGSDPRKLFLYTLAGRSSPFEQAGGLLHHLIERWSPTLHLVNVSTLDLSHYQDLLGLLEASVGCLSIDTSTIHIMPASKTPYIALVNDTKTPWWSSVPRGNCRLQIGYTQVMENLTAIDITIDAMVRGTELKPMVIKAQQKPFSDGKPHLITLASGDIAPVWSAARKTWEPWCAKRGLKLETNSKLPLPAMHPSWNKIPLVLKALESHEIVWWIDADLTVSRPDAELPTSPADLLFSTDWNGLCCALFRARSTPWTKAFLNALLALGDVRDNDQFGKGCGPKWEQNAIKLLLRDFPACDSHVAYIPRSFMTDRPVSNSPEPFYHFGGRPNAMRIAEMKRFHKL